jgi:hypothetical protein
MRGSVSGMASPNDVTVRDAEPADWAAIRSFMQRIVAAGETYARDRDIAESEAHARWMPARSDPQHGFVGLLVMDKTL